MSPSEPTWLGGYRLLRRLGAGGAGTVWEAEDEGGNRVALKMLHPTLAETEQGRRRLLREARLVNKIPGHGVARVLDVEAEDTAPFVVTELIEGPTLAQIVADSPLSPEECLHLALQLEDILFRIHQQGIVHRDLKPSNIIIGENGPVLIDFGIAQALGDERLTQTGKLTGTPGYVSPELLRDDRSATFDRWRDGDWWAWSALLLSSMTGGPPFGTGPLEAVVPRVLGGQIDSGQLPEALRQTFADALASDISQRLSPWEMIEALKEAVDLPESMDQATELVPLPAPNTEWVPSSPPDMTLVSPTATGLPIVPDYVAVPAAVGEVTPPWPGAALFAPEYPGYRSAKLPDLFMGICAFVLALSALAGFGEGPGMIVATLLVILFATWGQAHGWLEGRRERQGSPRSGDGALAALSTPWHLLIAALRMLPGIIASGLVLAGGWFTAATLQGTGGGWLQNLREWGLGTAAAGPGLRISWLISIVALLTMVMLPPSLPARQGIRVALTTTLPGPVARGLVYLLTAIGVGAAMVLLG